MIERVPLAVASPADFATLRRRFTSLPMRPKVLQTREGGTDISSPGRQSLSLLIGEETAGALYATDVYLSPGFGAPSHHQPTEEELWYLLEGELDVRVGAKRASLRAGAFAYIPRNTTHAFRNNGSSTARLLAWNSPAGHERAFEEMRRKADQGITAFPDLREMFRLYEVLLHADEAQIAPNDDGAADGARRARIVLDRAEAPDVSAHGADARLLLSAEQSGGGFEVTDVRLPRGVALPARREVVDVCVYLLAGAAVLSVDGGEQPAKRGAFAFIPRGHTLGIAAADGQDARFLRWTANIKVE